MTNIFKRFNSAIDYIEENLFDEFDIKKVCQILELNINVAGAVFELLTGYTIKEYVRKRRLSQAALFIQEDKIIDVAVLCGYDTREGFSRAFKAFHGETPSKCLKSFNYLDKIVFNENLFNLPSEKEYKLINLKKTTLYGEYIALSSLKSKKNKFDEFYLIATKLHGKTQYFFGVERQYSQDNRVYTLPKGTYTTCPLNKSAFDVGIYKKGKKTANLVLIK